MVTTKWAIGLLAFIALAGCGEKAPVAALPNENASEMKVLMQDCRDTYAAANAYAKKHNGGFSDQDKVKESLQPLLKPGSKADLSRFVQEFPGGRAAVDAWLDDSPQKVPEFGYYKGETGTATLMLNGDVRWKPN